ncbi:unnamed protein product [Bursaphelenchus xylophilus]|uniref:(pine wood nematode) hypothetical protein n=1 Tax=Bursaphelenchus xylophilus TaxID=6326 RepID=A0A1I7SBX8_BURXY|nr:unnamed protein product [Bursaphelenchus xylophilus]CAG9089093.1 unnamed protein product [Bursaphelenchus xylophilus]
MKEAPIDNFARDPRIQNFWKEKMAKIKAISTEEYRELTKKGDLPLARIKKIMKIDEQVRSQMISGEGPILIAKACEFLIEEITLRAWLHAEQNRRKTVQKLDISNAVAQSDMFDFLIDIVPRGSRNPNAPIKPNPGDNSSHELVEAGPSTSEAIAVSGSQPVQFVLPPEVMQGNFVNGEGPVQYIMCDPNTDFTHPIQVNMNGQVFDVTPTGQPIQLIQAPAGSIHDPNQ